MFEKVNPSHPDKVADRIAGAILDIAYRDYDAPKVACEVLIGHGECTIVCETSYTFNREEVVAAIKRIAGDDIRSRLMFIPQDARLASNQENGFRCGDNGIFRGMPITDEQKTLSKIARYIYSKVPYDGKYIAADNRLIVCQSHASKDTLARLLKSTGYDVTINPLGYWTGGLNVDTGATNRKLGSDMGDAVTGGGLHGKDLSKADVAVNIYAHLKAQKTGEPVELYCTIGDDRVDGREYEDIVEIARRYIDRIGGFEKFAEWGLIR